MIDFELLPCGIRSGVLIYTENPEVCELLTKALPSIRPATYSRRGVVRGRHFRIMAKNVRDVRKFVRAKMNEKKAA
jgi:hypothetical protein